MAFMICETHGGNVSPHVCPHIEKWVLARLPVADVTLVQAEWEGMIGWGVRLCRACAMQRNYQGLVVTLHGDAGLDEAFFIDQYPVCSVCLDECQRAADAAAIAVRDHRAFLRGYSPEDEGLYDDLPAP